MDKELSDEFRRAYSQWDDRKGTNVAREVRLGDRMRDAMVAVDTAMVRESGQLDAWPATVAWVADDTETCVFCAWPESSTVVLRIGHSITVCQDHIWRGLLAKLGDHPRGDYAKAEYDGQD
jgi:hypothetical protein